MPLSSSFLLSVRKYIWRVSMTERERWIFFCSLIEGKKDKTFERERRTCVSAAGCYHHLLIVSAKKRESLLTSRRRVFVACVLCVCFCASCVEQQQQRDRDYRRRGISLTSLSLRTSSAFIIIIHHHRIISSIVLLLNTSHDFAILFHRGAFPAPFSRFPRVPFRFPF